MREAKSVQRMPEAKLRGASMDFVEPHGPVGRQHCRCDPGGDLIAEAAMWLRRTGKPLGRSLDRSASVFADRFFSTTRPLRLRMATDAGAFRIADQRSAWSCAKRNPFSECRWRSCWELPWISRSRMAMSVASIADAISAEIRGAATSMPALRRCFRRRRTSERVKQGSESRRLDIVLRRTREFKSPQGVLAP
jgi:hypothetical protein